MAYEHLYMPHCKISKYWYIINIAGLIPRPSQKSGMVFTCTLCDHTIPPAEMSLTECGQDGGMLVSSSGGPKYCEARSEVPAGIYCEGWSGKL